MTTALLAALAPAVAMAECRLNDHDITAVRAATAEYVTAWLSNDEGRVMALLTEDAVLMPHHGAKPHVGKTEARAFWFPEEYPPAIITLFEQETLDVQGCGDLAIVRGKQDSLEWSYDGERFHNPGSNFVSIYRKQDNGDWLLSWQIWNSLVTEQLTDATE